MSPTSFRQPSSHCEAIRVDQARDGTGRRKQGLTAQGWLDYMRQHEAQEAGHALADANHSLELESDWDCSSVMSLSFGMASASSSEGGASKGSWGSEDEGEGPEELASGCRTPTQPVVVDVRAVLMAPRKQPSVRALRAPN